MISVASVASKLNSGTDHAARSAPLGVTGITLDYSLNRWFVTSAGAGTNARSYELEGATKLRFVIDETLATGIGVGLAYGQPQSWCYHAFDPPTCNAPDPVPSAFFELFADARSPQGIVARLYGSAMQPFRGEVQSTFLGLHMTLLAPYVGRRLREELRRRESGIQSECATT